MPFGGRLLIGATAFQIIGKTNRPASQGCRGGSITSLPDRICLSRGAHKETKMPKLKTKSGVKKRFKLTATGKVKHGVAG